MIILTAGKGQARHGMAGRGRAWQAQSSGRKTRKFQRLGVVGRGMARTGRARQGQSSGFGPTVSKGLERHGKARHGLDGQGESSGFGPTVSEDWKGRAVRGSARIGSAWRGQSSGRKPRQFQRARRDSEGRGKAWTGEAWLHIGVQFPDSFQRLGAARNGAAWQGPAGQVQSSGRKTRQFTKAGQGGAWLGKARRGQSSGRKTRQFPKV
jgi:hypothetical protein